MTISVRTRALFDAVPCGFLHLCGNDAYVLLRATSWTPLLHWVSLFVVHVTGGIYVRYLGMSPA